MLLWRCSFYLQIQYLEHFTEKGTAKFVVNVAGEPYYMPGFDSLLAFCGLIAVFALVRKERFD